jgi:CcmD family protein
MSYLRPLILACVLAVTASAIAVAQPQPSPDEFVPMSEVPPEEQIPAITLVGAAYAFVWIAVFGYVWSLGRRLGQAEADLARLEKKDR